ncbi:endothelin-converting enzyme-like 1 isoform X2 [Dermacentor albipictus]|uniref:endothelin-converting enzyme-like 1 isoform X2 n=1 Tax=Dermacentor albipictus TaxID=60249 RepID=UPI0038FD2E8D
MDSGLASPKSVKSQRSAKFPKAQKASRSHKQSKREKHLPEVIAQVDDGHLKQQGKSPKLMRSPKRTKSPKSPLDPVAAKGEGRDLAERFGHLSPRSSVEFSQLKEMLSADDNASALQTPVAAVDEAKPPPVPADSTNSPRPDHKSSSQVAGVQVSRREHKPVVHGTNAPDELVSSIQGSSEATDQAREKPGKEEHEAVEQGRKGKDDIRGQVDDKGHQKDGVQGPLDQHDAPLNKVHGPMSKGATTLKPDDKMAPVQCSSTAQERHGEARTIAGQQDKAPALGTAAHSPALGMPRMRRHIPECYGRLANGQAGPSVRLPPITAYSPSVRGGTTPGATSITSKPTGAVTPGISSVQEDLSDRESKPVAGEVAMERVALRSTIVSCLVLVTLSLSLTLYMLTSRAAAPPGGRRKQGLCVSQACRLHAHLVTTLVDPSRDPCDDLEAFACSKWAPRITNKLGKWFGYSPALTAHTLAEWFDTFKDEVSAGAVRLAAGRHALAAFEACRDDNMHGEHKKRLDVLRQFIKERKILWPEPPIEGVHPLGVLLDLAYNWRLNLWFEARPLLSVASSKTDLLLNAGGMVPFWFIYQQGIRRENYVKYWEMLYALFSGGAQSDLSVTEISKIATVEQDIFHELTLIFQHPDKQPARILVRNIGQHTPAIPSQEWKEQLDSTIATGAHGATGYDTFESVAVSDKALLEAIDKLFGKYSRREMLQQISWFFVQVFAPLVNGDIFLALYRIKDAAALRQRMFCAQEVEEMYGPLVPSLYVAVNFDEEDRKSIDKDLADVVLVALDKVANISSLTNVTRNLIANKLDTLTTVLWPPNDFLTSDVLTAIYANFSPHKDTFIQYWIDARQNMMRLYQDGPTHDPMPRLPRNYRLPFFTYDYLTNSVLMSVAALSKHVFTSPNGTAAMRLGTIGFDFARQLVRVFDNAGLRVDAKGNLLDEPVPFPAMNRSECTVQDEGDGIQELPALEVAYAAFEERARNSSQRVMEAYSEEQVFFITVCFSLCRQPKTLRSVFASGCNEVAANFEPFSIAFNCSSGARMNPVRKCTYFK